MLASNLSLARSIQDRLTHTRNSPKNRTFTVRIGAHCNPVAPPRPPAPVVLGLGSLMETFAVEVQRAESRALDVPLVAPFTIATSRLEGVGNVAVRVELRNGCAGWGEAPVLPSVTAEDQGTALGKAREACEALKRSPAMGLGRALGEIAAILPGHEFASVRAGVEMALIDAVANSIGTPLWKLFGGASNTLTTDITIPIVSPAEAADLALKYRKQGFQTLKLKVGKDLKADIEGYKSSEAILVLDKLHEMGVTPILFEQPVHRDDWEGLGHVSRIAIGKYGISVAADESCRSLDDVKTIPWALLATLLLALVVSSSLILILPYCWQKIQFLVVTKCLVPIIDSEMPEAMAASFIGITLSDW
ncbi:hypothetical protein NL676_029362 [Syzygium grande]|nr:hypothetical protein NL676_029362 [Syzygium grande]